AGVVLLLAILGQNKEAAQKIKQAYARTMEQGLESMLITISPGGIATRNRLAVDSLKWEGIAAVEATADHVFIFTANKESTYIIPRGAFEDEDHFVASAERARKYHEQSRAATEPPPA